MPVPGLVPNVQGSSLSIAYQASVNNVDLFADLGSPENAVHVFVLVDDSVTIGAVLNPGATEPDPAFLIDGFASGSVVYLLNRGRIAGGGGIGGQGDRGRRDNQSASSFVGGGGGGGAGSTSQGGAAATESDPDDDSTDGSAGTSTTGGAHGDNDSGAGIGNGGYTRGDGRQFGGAAIVAYGVELTISNAAGEIIAGANGGAGGRQTDALPGGAIDPEDGDDLAGSVTTVAVAGDEPEAVIVSTGATLAWVDGDTYPNVAGYVRELA